MRQPVMYDRRWQVCEDALDLLALEEARTHLSVP